MHGTTLTVIAKPDGKTERTLSSPAATPSLITAKVLFPEKNGSEPTTTTPGLSVEGASCIVNVDASAAVARVVFDDTSFLGIEYDAKIGEVITIESGVEEIEIYNGAESGPLHFIISFSGANAIYAGAVTTALAAALF
eukprot:CAMPEP_0176364732 /NCGR_PEP_ID=MMETSP0126-20121128/19989_1 /TAXON_ID=141414 ORGANISM="Strombidinopsis acuminatum, Strain SPMC142" /NCGR_SAMPLE_ID=MMETSP0126 /ASSEMBLY_ACC=CAM_ASM_000229 /LENGTH=137 /DNA_ID=CAMNT_0017721477 /DNA_START=230 /DNA_END=642 /DNA_ORIENTATION=+